MDLAKLIDNTLLKPASTREQILALCDESAFYHFASVCVNPANVAIAAERLRGTGVKVCTVIGFPLGANTSETKAFEAAKAVRDGADELDMVINIGALKAGDDALVQADIEAVVKAGEGRLVKVIIETFLLTDEEKKRACLLAKAAGADFVKTCTGFSGGAANVHDIALMRETVGPDMGVKASGGVRTREDAEALVAAGATRIGTSSGKAIIGA